MKLKNTFITYDSGDDHILIDASSKFSGLAHSNPTATFILECLQQENSESEIVSKMLEKYDASEDVIARDVRKIIEQLRGIGALDE